MQWMQQASREICDIGGNEMVTTKKQRIVKSGRMMVQRRRERTWKRMNLRECCVVKQSLDEFHLQCY